MLMNITWPSYSTGPLHRACRYATTSTILAVDFFILLFTQLIQPALFFRATIIFSVRNTCPSLCTVFETNICKLSVKKAFYIDVGFCIKLESKLTNRSAEKLTNQHWLVSVCSDWLSSICEFVAESDIDVECLSHCHYHPEDHFTEKFSLPFLLPTSFPRHSLSVCVEKKKITRFFSSYLVVLYSSTTF